MSNTKSSLGNLKSKLAAIQANLDEIESQKSVVKKTKQDLTEKLNEFKTNQNNRHIRLNIGGKIFETMEKTLQKDQNCLFAVLLEQNKTEYFFTDEIFIDRSPYNFDIILNYLRDGQINYSSYSEVELKSLYLDSQFYEISDIRDYLDEKYRPIAITDVKYTGPYIFKGQTAGSLDLLSINNEDLMTGVCCNAPGKIEVEFNGTYEVSEIRLGSYQGNLGIWYPGNGSGAKIYSSENGKDYKYVDIIPSKFTKEIITIKLKDKIKLKYLKFECASYLGLGFLGLTRDD